jgi:hypothetical protein
MAWRVAKSLIQLNKELLEAFPNRSTVSDGTIGDTAHSSRKSDHNPDSQGIVRARDFTEWDPNPHVSNDDVAYILCEFLRKGKDPRVKYVISRGRMFSSYATQSRKAWEWGPYTGPNGHFRHAHVSVQPGALGDDGSPWGLSEGTIVDMPLTDADKTWIKTAIKDGLQATNTGIYVIENNAKKRHESLDSKIERILAWCKRVEAKIMGEG